MTEEVNIAFILDRFLSANTAADVQRSLEHLLEAHAGDAILAEPDALKALVRILATQSYNNIPVEDGDNLCARIFYQMLQHDKPAARRLLERQELLDVLMDVAASSDDDDDDTTEQPRSSYTRVICLQCLELLCQNAPKLAQQQLLQAPNGLHRLGTLLHVPDLAVRNQALLVAQCCAEWPAVSKVWIFLNVAPTVMDVALQEGGLTGGNIVVVDSLRLLYNLLRHDKSMAELVMVEHSIATQLTKLLDLRMGTEFIRPVQKKKKQQQPLLARKKVDDLDDLLKMDRGDAPQSTAEEEEEVLLPRLTRAEEKVITAVFDILELVLENDSVRQVVWTKHSELAGAVWELGLVSPPPPGAPPCAYPSAALQQQALQMTARYLNDPVILDRHRALDRLLYLCCTGGLPNDRSGKLGVSQSALHVLRRTVPPEWTQEMLLHTMAPTEEGGDATPVDKLMATVAEHLTGSDNKRTVFLFGSTCALSLFLVDTASREMMLRLWEGGGLLHSVLELLPAEPDSLVSLALLRFLCQWMDSAPLVVQSILSLPQSAATFAALLDSKDPNVAAYASLVLGMALDQMKADEVSKYGGWTREGILDLYKQSLSLFLSRFDDTNKDQSMWSFCRMERQVWLEEFQSNVWSVRKRVVTEMTVHGDSSDEMTLMQSLVAKQSSELEELRQELMTSKQSVAQQEKELSIWKIRAESTPTQLDEMLSDCTSRNTELEQKVEKLERMLDQVKADYASETSRHTELVESLQTELNSSLQKETQTRENLESVHGEMAALSQAYANLEDEFHRQAQVISTTAAAVASSAEDHHPHSTEVATLRAENTRLKNDVKAADEWMAMAVNRMNEFGTENTSLNSELAILRERIQPLDNQNLALQHELDSLRKLCAASNDEDLRSILSQTSQQLEIERKLRNEAEEKLTSISGMLQSVEKDKAYLEQQVSELNHMLTSEKSVNFDGSQPNPFSGEREVGGLHEECEAVKAELALERQTRQEEVGIRDARIRELESLLGDGNDTMEEVLKRDKEIEELKQLNQAAQDWIDMAVQHHTALAAEVASLTMEKSTLSGEVDQLNSKLAALTSSSDSSVTPAQSEQQMELISLTKSLQEKDFILEESNAMLSKMKESLEEKENHLDSMKAELQLAHDELQSKCSELELLRSSSGIVADEMQSLREQAATLLSREKELQSEIEELRKEMTSKQGSAQSLPVENDNSQESFALQIDEYKAMITNLEAQLSEQETDLNEIVKEWETTYNDLEKRHTELLNEKEILEGLCEEKEKRISELQDEIQDKGDKLGVLSAQLEEKVRLLSSKAAVASDDLSGEDKEATIKSLSDDIEMLKQELKAKEEESLQVISQWQASYNDLESRYAALCSTKDMAVPDGEDAGQSDSGDGPADRVSELTAQITSLQQQLVEAETESADVVAQWQQAYAESEEKVRLLSSKAAVASDDLSGEDKEATIKSLSDDIEMLKQELKAKEEESLQVISQWQASYNDLESRYAALCSTKNMAVPDGEDAGQSDIGDGPADRVSELTAQITSLQQQLVEAETESADVVAQWQQAYAESEEKVRLLSSKAAVASDDLSGEDKEATIKSLSDDIEMLKQELKAKEEESLQVISQWQASYNDLESRYAALCSTKNMAVPDGEDAGHRVLSAMDAGHRVLSAMDAVTSGDDKQASFTDMEFRSAGVRSAEEVHGSHSDEMDVPLTVDDVSTDSTPGDEDSSDDKNTKSLSEAETMQLQVKNDAVLSLSRDLDLLRVQLFEQEAEAENAIKEWEACYAELQVQLERVMAERDSALSLGSPSIKNATSPESIAQSEDTGGSVKKLTNSADDTQRENEFVSSESRSTDNEILLDALRDRDNRIIDLTNQVSLLKQELVESEGEAANAIDQWEQTYANLEKELQFAKESNSKTSIIEDIDDRDSLLAKMTIHVATLKEQLLFYQTQSPESPAALQPESSMIDSLQAEADRLREDLRYFEEEKQKSLSEFQERLAEATSNMVEAEGQVKLLQTELQQLKVDKNEKEELLMQLRLERSLLHESLKRTEDEGKKDAQSFEIDRKKLEDDLSRTREELKLNLIQLEKLSNEARESQEALAEIELKFKGGDEEDRLRSLLKEQAEAISLLEEELRRKTLDLEASTINSDKFKFREAELEREIARLHTELEVQEDEAETAIASWEARCVEIEELCNFAQDDKEKLEEALERARTLEIRLRETEEHFNSRLEAAVSEHDRVQQTVADTLRLQKQEEYEKRELVTNTLQNENAALEAERDRLAARVTELEDEVLESNSAMRICVTNGISDKAYEIATQSLLEQLNDLSAQATSNATRLATERQNRLAAEEEVKRLRSDLAIILGMEDTDENHAEIQKLTIETKGSIQRKEKTEIESLRSSLERAQVELSKSKASEMASKEHAAKAHIQASMFEQDLISSKDDFQYMVKTLDEMREAESSRRVSFEYRISSLQNDQAMLKRVHAAEMDSLRNELNQVCMERDHLFTSLKDSEKSKETLALASNRAHLTNKDEEIDLHAELDILRIERAQLLSAAAQDALQYERRLHDAVAAERSSSEADLILEKELRLSAERAVKALKLELEHLRSDLDRPAHPEDANETKQTHQEVQELKAQIEDLLEQQTNFESQLETIKSQSQQQIDKLTRECLQAKSRAMQGDRENRLEVDFMMEMSRFQASNSLGSNGNGQEEDQGLVEEKKDPTQLEHLHALYDVIKEQRDSIEEERNGYLALLADQEDLLALLAQQDLLGACLKAALSRLGGTDAVEEATHEAREKATTQYGKYIEIQGLN